MKDDKVPNAPHSEPTLAEQQLGQRLDEHFFQKAQLAKNKFGPLKGAAIVEITRQLLYGVSVIDADRTQVQFIQDWVDEVADIMKPNIIHVGIIQP